VSIVGSAWFTSVVAVLQQSFKPGVLHNVLCCVHYCNTHILWCVCYVCSSTKQASKLHYVNRIDSTTAAVELAHAYEFLPCWCPLQLLCLHNSYNSAIAACAAVAGREPTAFKKAMDLLDEMRRRGLQPDKVYYSTIATLILLVPHSSEEQQC
jgi:hypothetical protein